MTWFRVDDSFYGHPKAVKLSNDSLATWTRAGEWCAWQLTDGVFPRSMLPEFAGDAQDPDAVADDLLDRRLWEPSARPDHLVFHDWDQWQPTRAQERRARWLASRRDQATGQAAGDHGVSHGVTGDGSGPASADADDPDDHGVSHGVTDHGVSHTSPTRPDPTGSVGSGRVQKLPERNAQAREDDDDELTQVQALMAAAGRPVGREDAAKVRDAVLAKGGNIRNRRAFIGRVLGDPKQARGYAPGAGHAPTAREIIDATRHPGGPSADPEGRAAEARKQLANRDRPPAAPPPEPAPLYGEALARAQLAETAAARRAELMPMNQGPRPEPGPEPAEDPEAAEWRPPY
jgi:hypothetical protein